MFERFTDDSRRVVVDAQEQARLLSHNYIGTEHLLLGLSLSGTATGPVLEALGFTNAALRESVIAEVGLGKRAPEGHIPFTPNAKAAMERTLRVSLQLGHAQIRPEHLLLALLQTPRCVAYRILSVDEDASQQIAEAITNNLGADSADTFREVANDHEPVSGPLCQRCRSRLEEHLAYRTVNATNPDGTTIEVQVAFCEFCGVTVGTV